jgi:hypothetical protein
MSGSPIRRRNLLSALLDEIRGLRVELRELRDPRPQLGKLAIFKATTQTDETL